MPQTELQPMEWPAITILILLALAVVATIFYVRSVTRTGFNDPPAGEEEDNSIGEALNWRNEQEFKSPVMKIKTFMVKTAIKIGYLILIGFFSTAVVVLGICIVNAFREFTR